jgi:hypothetical protein
MNAFIPFPRFESVPAAPAGERLHLLARSDPQFERTIFRAPSLLQNFAEARFTADFGRRLLRPPGVDGP